MAEDGRRNAAVIDASRLVAEECVGKGLTLTDRNGRQLHSIGHVTNSEDRSHRRPVVFIDLDLARLTQSDPHLLESQSFDIGLSAGGEEQLVCFEIVAAGHAYVELAIVSPIDPIDCRVELEIEPLANGNLDQAV